MSTTLKKRIMRRAYAIFILRKVFHPTWVKVYIMVAVFWQLSQSVSVFNVFKNAPGSLGGSLSFLMNAFVHTEIAVQLIVAAGAAIILWLVWDLGRSLQTTTHPAL